jgi:CRP/FNR family cyclic AMP-dependent transcriptional regulator
MDLNEQLSEIYLFRNMTPKQIDKIGSILRWETFSANSIVYQEEEPGSSCFLVKSGGVRITVTSASGNEEVARIGSGSLFGELALLGDHRRMGTATTTERTELLRIEEDDLNDLLDNDPGLAAAFYKALAKSMAARLEAATRDVSFLRTVVHEHHL